MENGVELYLAAKAAQNRPADAHSLYERALAVFRREGETQGEAAACQGAATALRRLGRPGEGIPYLTRALEIFDAVGDATARGVVHHDLGLAYERTGHPARALELYRLSLKPALARGDRGDEAVTRTSIGRALRVVNDLDGALDAYRAALICREEVGEPRGTAITLGELGSVLRVMGRLDESVAILRRAVELARRSGDARETSIALGELGATLLALDEVGEAVEISTAAVDEARASGDPEEVADKLFALGIASGQARRDDAAAQALTEAADTFVGLGLRQKAATAWIKSEEPLVRLGRREDALQNCEAAAAAYDSAGDPGQHAVAHLKAGDLLRELSRPAEALARFDAALERFEAADRTDQRPAVLVNVGLALEQLGRLEEAVATLMAAEDQAPSVMVKCLAATSLARSLRLLGRLAEADAASRRALDLAQEVTDSGVLANVRANHGRVLASSGRLTEALEYLQEAVATEDRWVRAAARSSIADVLLGLGRPEAAAVHLRAAADEAKAVGAPQTYGVALNEIGRIMAGAGDHGEALRYYDAAAQALRAGDDLQGEGATLHNAGEVALTLGRHTEARELVERALALARQVSDGRGAAACLLTLARTLEAEGDTAAALRRFADTCDAADRAGAHDVLIIGLRERARMLETLGRDAEALETLLRAAAELESLRRLAGAGELRQAVQGRLRYLFEALVRLLVRAGRRDEAFAYSEASHARSFLDDWPGRIFAPHSDDELRREARDAHRALRLARQARDGAPGAIGPASDVGESIRSGLEIHALEQRVRALDARLAVTPADLQEGRHGERTSVSAVQERIVGDGRTALLEFLLGDQSTHLFVVTAASSDVFTLGPRLPLEEMAAELHFRLTDRDPPYPHTRALHDALLAPAAELLRAEEIERLVVVADGALHVVPWLLLEDADGPLLDRYTIQGAPSAAVALAQRDAPPLSAEDNLLLAFGDPRGVLRRIPHTAHEVTAIAHGFTQAAPAIDPADDDPPPIDFLSADRRVAVMTGHHATLERFLAATADNRARRYLHLATHGVADPEHPERSRIVLSGVDEGEDPFLYSADVAALNIPCDLCVLSACETGMGRLVAGEGLVGLWRSFALAGARSLCASFWKVQDAATAHLMTRFYCHLRAGHDPAHALRFAQLDIRAEHPDPFLWAAFRIVL